MGQLSVPVILRNAREYVLAQHGHQAFETVHTYETTEALIDTGALHVVLPPAVAAHLGLWRMGYTGARLADGRTAEVPLTEGVYVEIQQRQTLVQALVMGDTVRIGAIVLEGLDLAVDCLRGQVTLPMAQARGLRQRCAHTQSRDAGSAVISGVTRKGYLCAVERSSWVAWLAVS